MEYWMEAIKDLIRTRIIDDEFEIIEIIKQDQYELIVKMKVDVE